MEIPVEIRTCMSCNFIIFPLRYIAFSIVLVETSAFVDLPGVCQCHSLGFRCTFRWESSHTTRFSRHALDQKFICVMI